MLKSLPLRQTKKAFHFHTAKILLSGCGDANLDARLGICSTIVSQNYKSAG
jgi:hypothetical protein